MTIIRRCNFLIICVLCCLAAQASAVDSLRALLPSLGDDEKSETYRLIYRKLNAQDNVQATLSFLDEWIAFEHQRGNDDEEAKARWSRVAVMNNQSLDSMMLKEAPEQMEWFARHKRWDYYYDTWDCKTNVYLYSGHLQTALREAQLMLEDAQGRNNSFGRAIAYQEMVVVYETMGLYDEAIEVFRKCVAQLKVDEKNTEALTNVYDYLCQTLDEKKDFEEELAVTREWEEFLKKRIAAAEKQPEAYNDTYLVCLCCRASALTHLGRLDEARQSMLRAEELLAKINSPIATFRVYYDHLRLALAQGNAVQAQAYCDKMSALGIDAGGDVQLLQGDTYMLAGRTREAANIFRNLYLSMDSTFSRDMRNQLSELNMLYKVDELKMQSQLQRSHFWIGIIVLIVLALLLFLYLSYRSAKRMARGHALLQESNDKLEQSYRELQMANARAEELSKMKSNFIRQISHEIRTPLNVLSGFTQVVTTPGVTLDDATKTDINQRITENTDRITGLVNKMLELSEANSVAVIKRTDDVLATVLARRAVETSRVEKSHHVTFVFEAEAGMETLLLHTNAIHAQRVLELLLDNAEKFSAEGRVSLRIAKLSDQQVAFMVEDTGIGVPASEAEHIFEEFVQLDEYYDGTGIGLTVARSIARRLGGDVVLDTAYQQGARFVFTLPL